MMRKAVIIGASGHGREMLWLTEEINHVEPRFEVLGFVDDDPHIKGRLVCDKPVLDNTSWFEDHRDVAAIWGVGIPEVRKRIFDRLAPLGLEFATLVHPSVHHSRFVTIGEGAVICAGCVLTTQVTIGRHALVNLNCAISHDTVIGDFSTIATGCNVPGNVVLGTGVQLGASSAIKPGRKVGDWAVLGTGAIAVKDVPPGLVVVGVPARPLDKRPPVAPVAIYGAGDFAREVAWLVGECGEGNPNDEIRNPNVRHSGFDIRTSFLQVVCIVDDEVSNQGSTMNGVPVMDLETAHRQFPTAGMVIAVGRPQTRERLARKAAATGFRFDTIIHPDVRRSARVEIGGGTVVCAGSIITTDVVLGAHVQINLDCTIGHDTILNDYATLAPGVHVSGHVNVGSRAYIGTGAVIINGCAGQPLTIGEDSIVAAGAVVTKPVPPRTTVVGVPARPLQKKLEEGIVK